MSPLAFPLLLVLILFTGTAILVIHIFKRFPDSNAAVNVNEAGSTEPANATTINPLLAFLLKRLSFNVKGVIAGIIIMLLVESLMFYLFYNKIAYVYTDYKASQSTVSIDNTNYKKQVSDLQSQVVDLKRKLPWKISFIITKCYKKPGLEFTETEYNQLFSLSDIAVSPYMYKPAAGQRMVIAEINEESLKEVNWTCSLISKQFGTRVFYKTDSSVNFNANDKTITIGPIPLNTSIQDNSDYQYSRRGMKDQSTTLQQ